MKTSCFSIAGTHPNAVAICRRLPRWMPYTGARYLPLAPTTSMLKMPDADFDVWYSRQLGALNPHRVHSALLELAGADAVLLCHETPGIPCHRLTVARWLEAALGVDIPELDAPILTGKRRTTNPRPNLTDPVAVEGYLRRQLRLDGV